MTEKKITIDNHFINKIRDYQRLSPLQRLNILERYRRFIAEALPTEKKETMNKLKNMNSWGNVNEQ